MFEHFDIIIIIIEKSDLIDKMGINVEFIQS